MSICLSKPILMISEIQNQILNKFGGMYNK